MSLASPNTLTHQHTSTRSHGHTSTLSCISPTVALFPYFPRTAISVGCIVGGFIIYAIGKGIIHAKTRDHRERYNLRQALTTAVAVAVIVALVIIWGSLLRAHGTFFGLVGAGLAVALKEPLLAVAGRIIILFGKMYGVGDRIEINKITGDVIDVGFFYTRMMEVGNWIHGDQATGRIVQFSNSRLFSDTAVYNYTQNFSYIWDEVKLPITYASNIKATTEILLGVGGEYTKEFLEGAQQQMEQMRRYFLVPQFELKPQVYLRVTDNWIELNMRYLVDPKRRRAASSFIYSNAFASLQGRDDITIASSTSDVAIHWSGDSGSSSKEAQGQPKQTLREDEEPLSPDQAA